MTRERELLTLVLSYAENLYLTVDDFEMINEIEETFKNIKEFLAQPEQEGVYQKLSRIEDGIEVEILPSEVWLDGYEAGKRSALLSKQPEQEPVAWMWTRNYEGGGYTNKVFEFLNDAEEYAKDSKTLKSPDIIRPLYTAPPKREPLRDEEIVRRAYADPSTDTFIKAYAEAIEKAHGIGGEE